VGKLIGVIATLVVALSAAAGVGFTMTNASSQDKGVNLDHPDPPNGMNSGSDTVNYGTAP
jgi:hypothetical protein